MGTEEPRIVHYGTTVTWFKNFIEQYYLVQRKNFSGLIISTNNDFDELEDKYGFRVRSRLREMFNIVDVEGNDMRE